MLLKVGNERQRYQKQVLQDEGRINRKFEDEIMVPNLVMNEVLCPIVRAYRDIFTRVGPSTVQLYCFK